MTARGTVLVTDAARGSAVAVIRSLGAAGWRVVAADPARLAPGRWSRFTSVRARYPDPTTDAGEAVDAVVALAERHRVDLLVPVTDDIGVPLDEARHRLPATCRLAMPDPEATEVARDKARTVELARELGVPIPTTIVTSDPAEARALAPSLGWPVVVKPARSRRFDGGRVVDRFEVAYATTADEVERLVSRLARRDPVLLQQHCPGDAVGVELLLVEGRVVAAFQHRRLRHVPLSGGPSSLRESVAVDPDLRDHGERLLGALRWTGLAMVEFTVGGSGPRLMEVNGRVWGSLGLAVESGVDFPRLLGDVASGTIGANGANPTYRTGVRTRSLELELRWIAAVLRDRRPPFVAPIPRRRAAAAALSLLWPRPRFDVQRLTDPIPGLADLARIAGRARRTP